MPAGLNASEPCSRWKGPYSRDPPRWGQARRQWSSWAPASRRRSPTCFFSHTRVSPRVARRPRRLLAKHPTSLNSTWHLPGSPRLVCRLKASRWKFSARWLTTRSWWPNACSPCPTCSTPPRLTSSAGFAPACASNSYRHPIPASTSGRNTASSWSMSPAQPRISLSMNMLVGLSA